MGVEFARRDVELGSSGRSAGLVTPSNCRGAVVVLRDVANPASDVVLQQLIASLAESGYASLTPKAFDIDHLHGRRCSVDLDLANQCVDVIEAETGWAAAVLGWGVSTVPAVALAMAGRVHGAVLIGLDPILDRTLASAWDAATESFALEDRVVPGERAAVDDARDLLGRVDGRQSPAPMLVIADLDAMRHLDSQWCVDPSLDHEVVTLASDGDLSGQKDSTAWTPDKLGVRVCRWLDELAPRRLAESPRVDGLLRPPAPAPAAERGKVFISYTHRDGGPRATQIMKHLDAAGIRNFLDVNDLGVGNIVGIIENALRTDYAGGVLVATPGLVDSTFVRTEELPRLLTAAKRQDKALEVANDFKLPDDPTETDFDGPDVALGLPKDTLTKLTQFDFDSPEDMRGFLRGWLKRKVGAKQGEPIEIDISSYPLKADVSASVAEVRADLRIRADVHLKADVGTAPAANTDLNALACAFPLVSEALHAAAPSHVTITGGGHGPVGLALGGVLVNTKIKCPVTVIDKFGHWGQTEEPDPMLNCMKADDSIVGTDPSAKRVAVFVEISQRPNTLFEGFIEHLTTPIAGALRIRRGSEHEWVQPAEGQRLADSIAKMIRDFADGHNAQEVLLCGTFSFPLAVMLGRRLNTLSVIAYDLAKLVETTDGQERTVDSWYHRVLSLSVTDSQISGVNTAPIPTTRPATFR